MNSIKICPMCGSIDIGIPPAGLDLRLTFPDFCRECCNRGNFPEIEPDLVEDFRGALEQFQKKA
jgi:hypothetical protein